MICQFKEREFVYFASGQVKTLPEQALHDSYLIVPDGSVEGWNRLARLQRSMGFIQGLSAVPQIQQNINYEPIVREAISSYDGRMVQSAFVPSNQKGANEYEDQVEVINTLLAPYNRPPFPAPVKPNEDQAARIKACIDWIEGCHKYGINVEPALVQNVTQHMDARFGLLQKQNPQAAQQLAGMYAQVLKAHETAGVPPQQQQAPQQPQLPPQTA